MLAQCRPTVPGGRGALLALAPEWKLVGQTDLPNGGQIEYVELDASGWLRVPAWRPMLLVEGSAR